MASKGAENDKLTGKADRTANIDYFRAPASERNNLVSGTVNPVDSEKEKSALDDAPLTDISSTKTTTNPQVESVKAPNDLKATITDVNPDSGATSVGKKLDEATTTDSRRLTPGDVSATSAKQLTSAPEVVARSNDTLNNLSRSIPLDSSSEAAMDDFIRSPEVQNAIVERSPGGRYVRFMEKLGSGASKDVYRAYDTQEGIEVAWNVVSLTGVPKAERNRIVNEVRLLERLHHQNIISFHGSWVNRERQEVNFVTEILSSGTLKSFIKKVQVIRWKIAKRWAVQILNGLDYLHSQDPPVIHRDLKCENIFINGTSGDLRIGDLGLSTVHRNGKVLSVLGTPEFMAPDMYEETSYDEKVDVYAFGMCLLEIFTKEIPYAECRNPAQIYKKVSNGEPPEVLSRLQSKHARDFVLLCLGYKNEQGKYIRPSVSELLQHPFLMKRPNDDDEVVVDPPLRDFAISEASENPSPNITQVPRQPQYSNPSQSTTNSKADTMIRRRSPSTTSIDDQEADTFENMQESEITMRKVKVLMGRGQELEENEDINTETIVPNTNESSSFQYSNLGNVPQPFVEPPLPQQFTTGFHQENETQGFLIHDNVIHQSSQNYQHSQMEQQPIQSTVPLFQNGAPTSGSSTQDLHNLKPQGMPLPLQGQNPLNQTNQLNLQMHNQAGSVGTQPLQQSMHSQHQISRDPSSKISHSSSYLVAAAVIEYENPNIRPYADDILKLVVTLPVDGQTQNVQFDFHLVEDDPVQVAKEMVQELGIPQGAVLEISETISGLARSARMKQDRHAVMLQQSLQGQIHQQFAPGGVVHPSQHSLGHGPGHEYQHQSGATGLQQPKQTHIPTGRSQDPGSYQQNKMQQGQHIPISSTKNPTEVYGQHAVQTSSHLTELRSLVGSSGAQDYTIYGNDTSNVASFSSQQTHNNSTTSSNNHVPYHSNLSQNMQQQTIPPSGNTSEFYVGVQITQQGNIPPVTLEQTQIYQASNDLPHFQHNVVAMPANPSHQVIGGNRSLSSGATQFQYQQPLAGVEANRHVQMSEYNSKSSNSGVLEKIEQGQVQSFPHDKLYTQGTYSVPHLIDDSNSKHSVPPQTPILQAVALDTNYSQPQLVGSFPQVNQVSTDLSASVCIAQAQPPFQDNYYSQSQPTAYINSGVTDVTKQGSGNPVLPFSQQPQAFSSIMAYSSQGQTTSTNSSVAQLVGIHQTNHLSGVVPTAKASVTAPTFGNPLPQSHNLVTPPSNESLTETLLLPQTPSRKENGSDSNSHRLQDKLAQFDTGMPKTAPISTTEISPFNSRQQASSESSTDEYESDDDLNEEMKKLEEEFQRNLQRAQKVFVNRMDNLQRSQIEREAQHQKTLERHQKERADFEKRLAQEEEQQNRRIEQLQREWEKKRESMAHSKRKNLSSGSRNGSRIDTPEIVQSTESDTEQVPGSDIVSNGNIS